MPSYGLHGVHHDCLHSHVAGTRQKHMKAGDNLATIQVYTPPLIKFFFSLSHHHLLESTNRWSKIAQHLPGRTDNEIKNYWRTRVQKQAKQLQCDVNSKKFKDAMRYLWMPRLIERIQAASGSSLQASSLLHDHPAEQPGQAWPCQENSASVPAGSNSSDSVVTQFSSPPTSDSFTGDYYNYPDCTQGGENNSDEGMQAGFAQLDDGWYENRGLLDFEQGGWGENLWSLEDIWSMQQQV